MSVSGQAPTSRTAVSHERLSWFDPVQFICIAAALLVARRAHSYLRARREPCSAYSEANAALAQSGLNEAHMMAIIRSSMEAIIAIDEHQHLDSAPKHLLDGKWEADFSLPGGRSTRRQTRRSSRQGVESRERRPSRAALSIRPRADTRAYRESMRSPLQQQDGNRFRPRHPARQQAPQATHAHPFARCRPGRQDNRYEQSRRRRVAPSPSRSRVASTVAHSLQTVSASPSCRIRARFRGSDRVLSDADESACAC